MTCSVVAFACSGWQRKPYFFGHSGAALIAPPYFWLVSIVQGAPTASRTAKRLAKIRCFRRPREWFSPETKHLLLLLEPSYFVPIATKDCLAHSAALAKSSDKIHFRPAHLRLLLLAFPHISKKEMHKQTNATRRTTPKKIPLVLCERSRNVLLFRCWCKDQTPWCKRLKLQ